MSKFPFFPRLHQLLCTRPNSIPPAITTGIGPAGREVVYLQPPGGFSRDVESLEPALRTPESLPETPVPATPLGTRNLNLIADVAMSASSVMHASIPIALPLTPQNENTSVLALPYSPVTASKHFASPAPTSTPVLGPAPDHKTVIAAAIASAQKVTPLFPQSKRQGITSTVEADLGSDNRWQRHHLKLARHLKCSMTKPFFSPFDLRWAASFLTDHQNLVRNLYLNAVYKQSMKYRSSFAFFESQLRSQQASTTRKVMPCC